MLRQLQMLTAWTIFSRTGFIAQLQSALSSIADDVLLLSVCFTVVLSLTGYINVCCCLQAVLLSCTLGCSLQSGQKAVMPGLQCILCELQGIHVLLCSGGLQTVAHATIHDCKQLS